MDLQNYEALAALRDVYDSTQGSEAYGNLLMGMAQLVSCETGDRFDSLSDEAQLLASIHRDVESGELQDTIFSFTQEQDGHTFDSEVSASRDQQGMRIVSFRIDDDQFIFTEDGNGYWLTTDGIDLVNETSVENLTTKMEIMRDQLALSGFINNMSELALQDEFTQDNLSSYAQQLERSGANHEVVEQAYSLVDQARNLDGKMSLSAATTALMNILHPLTGVSIFGNEVKKGEPLVINILPGIKSGKELVQSVFSKMVTAISGLTRWIVEKGYELVNHVGNEIVEKIHPAPFSNVNGVMPSTDLLIFSIQSSTDFFKLGDCGPTNAMFVFCDVIGIRVLYEINSKKEVQYTYEGYLGYGRILRMSNMLGILSLDSFIASGLDYFTQTTGPGVYIGTTDPYRVYDNILSDCKSVLSQSNRGLYADGKNITDGAGLLAYQGITFAALAWSVFLLKCFGKLGIASDAYPKSGYVKYNPRVLSEGLVANPDDVYLSVPLLRNNLTARDIAEIVWIPAISAIREYKDGVSKLDLVDRYMDPPVHFVSGKPITVGNWTTSLQALTNHWARKVHNVINVLSSTDKDYILRQLSLSFNDVKYSTVVEAGYITSRSKFTMYMPNTTLTGRTILRAGMLAAGLTIAAAVYLKVNINRIKTKTMTKATVRYTSALQAAVNNPNNDDYIVNLVKETRRKNLLSRVVGGDVSRMSSAALVSEFTQLHESNALRNAQVLTAVAGVGATVSNIDFSKLFSDVGGISTMVDGLSKSTNELTGSVNQINGAVTALPGQLNQIPQQVGNAVSAAVAPVNDTVKAARGDIDALRKDMTSINQDVSSLQTLPSSMSNVVRSLQDTASAINIINHNVVNGIAVSNEVNDNVNKVNESCTQINQNLDQQNQVLAQVQGATSNNSDKLDTMNAQAAESHNETKSLLQSNNTKMDVMNQNMDASLESIKSDTVATLTSLVSVSAALVTLKDLSTQVKQDMQGIKDLVGSMSGGGENNPVVSEEIFTAVGNLDTKVVQLTEALTNDLYTLATALSSIRSQITNDTSTIMTHVTNESDRVTQVDHSTKVVQRLEGLEDTLSVAISLVGEQIQDVNSLISYTPDKTVLAN